MKIKEKIPVKPKFKLEPGFKQFLWKTGIFILVFIVFSLIIGSKIFTARFIDVWKISIYTRIGYILLFSILGFILLYRKRLTEFPTYKYKIKDGIMIALSVIALAGFYFIESYSAQINLTLLNMILVHALGISIFVFLALGVYGIGFAKHFVKKFKKELLYFLIFAIITYSFMNLVWSLWPYLSLAVLEATKFLLKMIGINITTFGTAGITVDGFSVIIAEACSGIYSIFIFTALYLFIVLLDWDKMNKVKAAAMFLPAVLGAFAFNMIRVFTLMLVGAYVSPNLALGMYHSYAGMIFFLIYFLLFWGLVYKWMKK